VVAKPPFSEGGALQFMDAPGSPAMLPFAEVSPGVTGKGFRRRPNFPIGDDPLGTHFF
jgi:hypothetical protein